jgi:hypothetical protein
MTVSITDELGWSLLDSQKPLSLTWEKNSEREPIASTSKETSAERRSAASGVRAVTGV